MSRRGDDLPEPYNLGRSCQSSAAMLAAISAVVAMLLRWGGLR